MVSIRLQALLLGVSAIISNANIAAAAEECKALPGDANWPAKAEWDALDKELEGRLLGPVTPLSAPCHDNPAGLGEYDEAECQTITDNWTKPQLHIERERISSPRHGVKWGLEGDGAAD